MSWTEERIQKLKSMWGHGFSASQIAAELGGSLTRNAVIGKAHRLNLATTKAAKPRMIKTSLRPRGEGRVNMPRKMSLRATGNIPAPPKKIGRSVIVPVDPQYRDPDFRPATAVKPLDMKESQCRWPLGDPRSSEFCYCGGQAHEGVPYCTEHAKLAYNNFGRARPSRAEEAAQIPAIQSPVLVQMVSASA